jgi:glycosidase
VFYEIFVRSFADSNADGIGDLRGLTEKLDYLNDGDPETGGDLGIDALWLMPVFASPSYHGYDVTDYRAIEPDYGTLEDFDRLLAEAHRRGIRVIVDLVLNHASAQHPWFQDALTGPAATHRNWFVWRADDPGWTQPWGGANRTWHPAPDGAYYYGIFWGGMPDLNYSEPAVKAEMAEVARFWLARGVDGFRLDATRHLFADGPGEEQNDRPATHAYLKEFARAVREAKPDAILVGENWTSTQNIAPYFGELPMNFNFPLAEAILRAAREGDPAPVLETLRAMAALYPQRALDAPFLTNHDQTRLATQLGGDLAKLKLAASILLTLPGAPFLYYGEEVGLENAPQPGDPSKRTPMPWHDRDGGGGFTAATAKPWRDFAPGRDQANVAAQTAGANSLLSHYRKLIESRHRLRPLRDGHLTLLAVPPPLLAYELESGGERLQVVHNLSTERAAILPPAPHGRRDLVWSSAALEGATLPPASTTIWRIGG